MTNTLPLNDNFTIRVLRVIGWTLVAALLAAPAIAMRLGAEGVDWTTGDFVFAAVMLGTLGGLIELAVRASRNLAFRIASVLAALMGFLTVWINLAVGIIGNENNALNQVFLLIAPFALLGSIVAWGRARWLAAVMTGAGAAMLVMAPLAIEANLAPLVFCLFAAAVWFTSAALFRRAGREAGHSADV